MTPETIEVDGVPYIRAYPVADGLCPCCGRTPEVTPREMIAALQAAQRKTGTPPTFENFRGPVSSRVVARTFGVWNRALTAAGIETVHRGVRVYWTRERILSAIHGHAATHDGNPPTDKQWAKAAPQHPASRTVQKCFGSWNSALEAAGYAPRGPYGQILLPPPDRRERQYPAGPVAALVRNYVAGSGELSTLAEQAGVDDALLGRLVRGEKTFVRATTADRILSALGRPDVWHSELEAA